MLTDRLRDLWDAGGCAVNAWLSIGDPFSAEIMAAQGYDGVTVDAQHGALDYAAALPMLQALRASGAWPMARVPWREPGITMKLLDAGCMGIICPMVNDAAEAAEFASFLRYPPRGTRSYGPTRVGVADGLAAYGARANDLVMGWAMIETAEGMRNLDAIAAVPGIDGLYIGPSDLSISLTDGRLPPGFDREEPEMIDAIRAILRAAKAAGKRAALHCGGPDYAARAAGWGFDLVTVSGDARILAQGAAAQVARFRALTGGEAKAPEAGGY